MDIAKYRNTQFKPEELGPLGRFYQETAKGYELRKIQAEQAMEPYESLWEDRYSRFEQERLKQYKQRLLQERPTNPLMPPKYDPAIINAATSSEELDALVGSTRLRPKNSDIKVSAYSEAYKDMAKKKNLGRTLGFSDLFTETGERLDYNEIVKKNTSKYGSVWWMGQEAENLLKNKFDLTEAEEQYTTYSTKAAEEMAALEQRNKEAEAAFYKQKEETLSKLAASAYRGATYIERPR